MITRMWSQETSQKSDHGEIKINRNQKENREKYRNRQGLVEETEEWLIGVKS